MTSLQFHSEHAVRRQLRPFLILRMLVMNPRYRRVRRIARQLGRSDSLLHIWAYSLHICHGFDLSLDYRHPRQVRDFIHEFHLDLHLREVLLHAGRDSEAVRSLKHWADLADFHNAIKKQCDRAAAAKGDILLTLHRIGHQQISNFDRVDTRYLGRYWSLFRRGPIADLLERNFGMTVLEYFLFVAGAYTAYLKVHESNLISDLGALDIPLDALRERVAAVSATPQNIRARLIARERHDSSWEYTFNEVSQTPLLRMRPLEPDRVVCPRPNLLIRRLLAGAYFDLVSKPGFADAFGDGVEGLVGDLIRRSEVGLTLTKPAPYRTGSGVRHGADWILSDQSGHVFVECKSSRIPLQAQVAPSAEDVSKGMERLADAIVQNYANIWDAQSNRTDWVADGLPVYSLIVTLEDWNLFSPIASRSLRALVEQKLVAKHLQASFIASMPYVVVSVSDLPDLTRALAEYGVARLLAEKCGEKYGQYLVSSFLLEAQYKSESSFDIFGAEGDELFRLFRERAALGGSKEM